MFQSLNRRIFRFFTVGVFTEILYLILFFCFASIPPISDALSVLISGSICILVNSYLHATFTFKLRHKRGFYILYLVVQLFCMFFTYLLSLLLGEFAVATPLVGLITLFAWASSSYLLCLSFINRFR